jgi:hypothetical protein
MFFHTVHLLSTSMNLIVSLLPLERLGLALVVSCRIAIYNFWNGYKKNKMGTDTERSDHKNQR